VRWPLRGGCRGCGHTTEALGCTCPREDCVCRAGRRARFDAAVATLSHREQQWLEVNRRRIADVFSAAGIDVTTFDRSRVDDILAVVDMAELRRIFHHEVAEAEDPAAMLRFLQALLPPSGTGPPSDD
jgi:hypothetical protein